MVLPDRRDELRHLLRLPATAETSPGLERDVAVSVVLGVELVGERLERLAPLVDGRPSTRPLDERERALERRQRRPSRRPSAAGAPCGCAPGRAPGTATIAIATARSSEAQQRRRDPVARLRQRRHGRYEREALPDDARVVPVDPRERAQRRPDDAAERLGPRPRRPATTSVGGNSYFVFSSRCWFSGKSGSSGRLRDRDVAVLEGARDALLA